MKKLFLALLGIAGASLTAAAQSDGFTVRLPADNSPIIVGGVAAVNPQPYYAGQVTYDTPVQYVAPVQYNTPVQYNAPVQYICAGDLCPGRRERARLLRHRALRRWMRRVRSGGLR